MLKKYMPSFLLNIMYCFKHLKYAMIKYMCEFVTDKLYFSLSKLRLCP